MDNLWKKRPVDLGAKGRSGGVVRITWECFCRQPRVSAKAIYKMDQGGVSRGSANDRPVAPTSKFCSCGQPSSVWSTFFNLHLYTLSLKAFL